MEEIYKDIKGYEGLYQVSNYGNVRSLERTVIKKKWIHTYIPEKTKNSQFNWKGIPRRWIIKK